MQSLCTNNWQKLLTNYCGAYTCVYSFFSAVIDVYLNDRGNEIARKIRLRFNIILLFHDNTA